MSPPGLERYTGPAEGAAQGLSFTGRWEESGEPRESTASAASWRPATAASHHVAIATVTEMHATEPFLCGKYMFYKNVSLEALEPSKYQLHLMDEKVGLCEVQGLALGHAVFLVSSYCAPAVLAPASARFLPPCSPQVSPSYPDSKSGH